MDVKAQLEFNGQTKKHTRNSKLNKTTLGMFQISFNEFKEKESLSCLMRLEITNIYEENDTLIEQKYWETFGILLMIQII